MGFNDVFDNVKNSIKNDFQEGGLGKLTKNEYCIIICGVVFLFMIGMRVVAKIFTGDVFILFLICIIGIIVLLIPGIIATRRKHAYKNIIWILGIAGITNGLTWFVAMFWALWPQEKSLIDPLMGNVTGTGVRNAGDTIGTTIAGVSQGSNDEINLRDELNNVKELFDQGLINEEEYKRKREKILNL